MYSWREGLRKIQVLWSENPVVLQTFGVQDGVPNQRREASQAQARTLRKLHRQANISKSVCKIRGKHKIIP